MKFELMKGIVENNNSPLKNGSVQVRVFGLHSFGTGFEEVKTEHLPWIEVVGDFVTQGVGVSKIPEIGSFVHVLVPEDLDRMMVIGTVKSQIDFNLVQQGEGSTMLEPQEFGDDDLKIIEPEELDTKTQYPDSFSLKTKTGHFIIQDDTEGNERLKLQHKTGQFFEFRPDGSFVVRSPKQKDADGNETGQDNKNFLIIEGSLEEYVQKEVKKYFQDNVESRIMGTLTEYVNGQIQQTYNDALTQTVEKQVQQTFNDSVNQKIAKVFSIDQDGNIEIKSQASIKIEAGGSCDIKGTVINLN